MSVLRRPIRSPTWPKMIAPIGRTTNAIAIVRKEARVAAEGAERLEEQRADEEGREVAEDVEVVRLERGADERRPEHPDASGAGRFVDGCRCGGGGCSHLGSCRRVACDRVLRSSPIIDSEASIGEDRRERRFRSTQVVIPPDDRGSGRRAVPRERLRGDHRRRDRDPRGRESCHGLQLRLLEERPALARRRRRPRRPRIRARRGYVVGRRPRRPWPRHPEPTGSRSRSPRPR